VAFSGKELKLAHEIISPKKHDFWQ
jgi:hypothetical protein